MHDLKTSSVYFKLKDVLFNIESHNQNFNFFEKYGRNLDRINLWNILKEINQIMFEYNPFDTRFAFNTDMGKL